MPFLLIYSLSWKCLWDQLSILLPAADWQVLVWNSKSPETKTMKVGLNKFVKSNGVNLFLAGFQKFEPTVLRWKACACVWRSCRSRALSLLSFSCFSVPCEENNKEMIHKNHQKSPPLNWGNFSWKKWTKKLVKSKCVTNRVFFSAVIPSCLISFGLNLCRRG